MTGRWIFGSFTCKAWLLSNFWFCSASVFNLCLVSWDRYVAVTSSLHYNVRMRETKVQKMIILIWTISFSVAVVFITQFHINASSQAFNCTVQGNRGNGFTVILVTAAIFILSVLFLSFVNGKVWFAARRQNRKIQIEILEAIRLGLNASLNTMGNVENNTDNTDLSTPGRGGHGRTLTRTIKQEIKTFKAFLVVIGVFVVCWCPFYVCIVVDSFQYLNASIFYLSVVVSYCNSAVNIFIYGIFSREFRKALVSKFINCRCICSGT
ncbi:octopamine receptor Oamb-like [Actinia tenebrosa]|uniref:Octopamine receptor Oamb-like n=1 Tax=Actinia tenebrosa TaxID=6105 RepID=A0A6P8IKM4_ACTTE|nr:octopamine receptor Oamb-like [Actinia tenebrosa]